MLLLISPAKTLDFSEKEYPSFSQPALVEKSKILVKKLKKLSAPKIEKLMKVSNNIATLNVDRYQAFSTPFTQTNAKPAMLAFKGDVYRGLDTEDFTEEDFEYAQKSLLILSGLYGVLRPLDLIQAYRLEMKTALGIGKKKNLYEFWGHKITQQINEYLDTHSTQAIVNLASNEYFKSVKPKLLKGNLYTIGFKEKRNGQYKTIAFNAKRARGLMCRFAIKNQLTKPEQLKKFALEDYTFNEEMSSENLWMFTR
ncbi:MAG: peroxide stress protein YaaA [Aureispira sp.]|nr:peroxide stress protein YaaA [Aureispira sp.]